MTNDSKDQGRDAFEADYANVWNAALKANGWNGDHTADDVKALREGNSYGAGRDYLNARWEGWQARAASSATAPLTSDSAGLIYPEEFTDELQWILGLVCFQCITYAATLRQGGRVIPNKAEAEQAATLDWMLRHYLRDPENWRKTAVDEMGAMRDAATQSTNGEQS